MPVTFKSQATGNLVMLAAHAEALLRGIAAHHAGVLPAWKELIEELFQQGLIKVVFATETLAAGINMAGNIGAGWWLARGARPGAVLALAYIAMGVGSWLAFTAVGYPVVQYLAVLVFSGVGGLIPGTLFGLAVKLAPDNDTVSTTVGWMQQFSALGQFIGPPVVAWVATLTGGWQWTWTVTGASSLLGLMLASRLQAAWRTRP